MAKASINGRWGQTGGAMTPKTFTCANCGAHVAVDWGFTALDGRNHTVGELRPCSACKVPALFDNTGAQFPSPPKGRLVPNLPPNVERVYNEIRETSASAPLACVLACRVLLMHVAVAAEKSDAKPNNFVEAVNAIEQAGYITPTMKGWVDRIRTKGNEMNHEKLDPPSAADVDDLVNFVEMLLTLVYDYPKRAERG